MYCIENTVDEYHSKISGYFETLPDALEAVKNCADWWRPNGTGRIYKLEFGLDKERKLVWKDGEFVNQ